ncbi:ATP-binding cassette domain-containing protein [Hymenobacter cellulosilyticus]|uniref:ATP-binding cassette domain-containing protein n=1 Tax=Hymenobacter cellulosilyticus TaxID=2932248 RepID=A0A8T9Q494_9BACT|nr:ATP-binding cassette domain-containing protein [Hymenobacter cellulosilyticus]UOQ70620.1 ATP-binding cassette domain-containing protein [Hymenobacter cellulosilyticus]
MLSIQNLGKSYGPQQVLQGVNLTLRPGSIHGLVGANGAGKTTLLHCLYGLLTDYSGQIQETTGLAIRDHTGVLPYEPYFYPRLTGREYLEFCLQARHRPGSTLRPGTACWSCRSTSMRRNIRPA